MKRVNNSVLQENQCCFSSSLRREKRKRMRFPFQAEVLLTDIHNKIIKGRLIDISRNGMFVETASYLSKHTPCVALIALYGLESKLSISINCSVSRHDESGIGLSFDSDLIWWPLFPIFSAYGKSEAYISEERSLSGYLFQVV